MKYKYIMPILMSVAMLTSCGNNNSVSNNIRHTNDEAKTPYYGTIEEMEEASEIIIKATRLDDEDRVINKVNGIASIAETYSKVKVEEIYKSNDNIKVGDIVTILENEVYDEDTKTIIHTASYSMMKSGCEYLLFLDSGEYNGIDYYYSLGVNYGTISLSDDGRYEEKDENGDYIMERDSLDNYKKFWDDIKKKYKL